MLLKSFEYHLPSELIAQSPSSPRDHSRLMLINRASNTISHHHFYDLPSLIPTNYHFLANNTKVFPARLRGTKDTGGKVEVLLLKKLSHSCYEAIVSPGLKPNQRLIFGPTLSASVVASHDRLRTLRFALPDHSLTEAISQLGSMPTPPYIRRMLKNNADYQDCLCKIWVFCGGTDCRTALYPRAPSACQS